MLDPIRPYLFTSVCLAMIAYFGWQALTGDRGLLTEGARTRALAERTAELRSVEMRRRELEVRVTLLRDDHLSRDLLDERARVVLGFAAPDEYVIRVGPVAPRRS